MMPTVLWVTGVMLTVPNGEFCLDWGTKSEETHLPCTPETTVRFHECFLLFASLSFPPLYL